MPILQDKVKTTKKAQELCIIFSRYPRAGTSKTRLIPHLGQEGAARLQRLMTENIVAEAAHLSRKGQVQVELAMAGASQDEMVAWLGRQFAWQEQVGENLGARMSNAFAQAFKRGFQHVVLVGADCPGVSTDILAQAFQALRHHDMVLGPTTDGGYYLIGLKRFNPALFANISWGSDKVLGQTMVAASETRLQTALLARLCDVDRPEDLAALPSDLLGQLP